MYVCVSMYAYLCVYENISLMPRASVFVAGDMQVLFIYTSMYVCMYICIYMRK